MGAPRVFWLIVTSPERIAAVDIESLKAIVFSVNGVEIFKQSIKQSVKRALLLVCPR